LKGRQSTSGQELLDEILGVFSEITETELLARYKDRIKKLKESIGTHEDSSENGLNRFRF
jgi:hypothetical protein